MVLGYTEITSISDDVCVLSAIGTAALINQQLTINEGSRNSSITPRDHDNRDMLKDFKQISIGSQKGAVDSDSEVNNAQIPSGCNLCHIPHGKIAAVNGQMKKCAVCKSV